MEPVFGEQYRVWIPDEPRPKSTQKPPNVRKRGLNRAQRAYAVQAIINTKSNYAPLNKTQSYQKYVAECIAYLPPPFPQFDKLDPIKVTFNFYKGKHAVGDLKNLVAGMEDGLEHSGRIPNDGQIVAYGEKQIYYYCDNPGVAIIVEIAPIAADYEWLYRWFQKNRKRTDEYLSMRRIEAT